MEVMVFEGDNPGMVVCGTILSVYKYLSNDNGAIDRTWEPLVLITNRLIYDSVILL